MNMNVKVKIDGLEIQRNVWTNYVEGLKVQYTTIFPSGNQASGEMVINQETVKTPLLELTIFEVLEITSDKLGKEGSGTD